MEANTFICIWCGREDTFPGMRFGDEGWACSNECYANYQDAYWRVREPQRYGRPTDEDRKHVQD